MTCEMYVVLTWHGRVSAHLSIIIKSASECLNFLLSRVGDHIFPPQLSSVWLQHFYKCAKVNRIFFLIRKGRQSGSFKALRAILPYLYGTSCWRSTLIHYYVKCIGLMKGKSLSGFGGLPWGIYIFWMHNIKSCHGFYNDELDLQAVFANKTHFTPLISSFYPYIFHASTTVLHSCFNVARAL